MTFKEFQYWLEGLEEGSDGKAPNQKQWKLIKEKMAEVVEPVTWNPVQTYPWRIEPYVYPNYPQTTFTWDTVTCESNNRMKIGGESMIKANPVNSDFTFQSFSSDNLGGSSDNGSAVSRQ